MIDTDMKRIKELVRDIGIQSQLVAMATPGSVSRDVEAKVLADMQGELNLLTSRRRRGQ